MQGWYDEEGKQGIGRRRTVVAVDVIRLRGREARAEERHEGRARQKDRNKERSGGRAKHIKKEGRKEGKKEEE